MSTFWDWVIHLSAHLNSGILSLVESLWLYPSVFAVALFDAIIPVFPSESVVIGSASAWQSTGHPNLFFLFVVAAAGAWCGDQTAYFIGTRVDVRSIKVFRRPKVLAALDWAEHSLEHRGALYIITLRNVWITLTSFYVWASKEYQISNPVKDVSSSLGFGPRLQAYKLLHARYLTKKFLCYIIYIPAHDVRGIIKLIITEKYHHI